MSLSLVLIAVSLSTLWAQDAGRPPQSLPSEYKSRAERRDGKRTSSPSPKALPEIPLPSSLPQPTTGPSGVRIRPLVIPNCRVRYASEVQVPATVPGKLIEVLVREGDAVKTGDVLARIDDEEARLEAELKGIAALNDSAVEAARARIGWYKQQYDSTVRLLRTGSTSAEEVEGRRQQWIASQHELRNEQNKRDQADAEYEKAESQLQRHLIVSPIQGVVRERRRHAFEAVQMLETLFHVVRTDRMKIEGEFDQRHLGRIARGMHVEVWPERIVGEIDRVNHAASVWCVRLLSDGKRLVFSTADGVLVVWNYAEQRRERVIPVCAKAVRTLATVSERPSLVLSGDDDGAIRCWDIDSGQGEGDPVRPSSDGAAVTALEADPLNADHVYVGLANGVVQHWDWKRGVSNRTFVAPGRRSAHVNQVTSLSVSSDGRKLLSAADDRVVALWPTSDGGQPLIVAGRNAPPDKEVRQFNLTPSGAEFPFGVFGVLQTRRATDGLPTMEIERAGERDSFVWVCAFTPRPGMLVSGRESGDLELWRMEAGRPPRLCRLFAGHDKERTIRRVDFSTDGGLMASCGDDRTVRLWSLPTAEVLDGERTPGAVVFVSPQVEPGTNAVKFYAEAINPRGLLTANARATLVAYPKD